MDLNFSVTLNAPEGELAVIRARGADAGSFLQGQLTQDVLLMKTDEARLAAWCSAKGRMLASFIVLKLSSEEFLLILSRDLLAATLKRLKMFVLRAKCELADITGEISIEGVAGSAARNLTDTMNTIALRADSMPANGSFDTEIVVLLPPVHMNGTSVPRALRIRASAPAVNANREQTQAWCALEIASGIARLSAAVSEAFVPQMLNYESVGGVNFKKGCYPGQEVVARSQFRGTLKRRAYIATSASELQAGQEVFDSREPDQPCGQIAQAAVHPAGGYIAIVSMQISAHDGPALHASSASGALLQLHTLPYELLADV
ncbi:folate-binding protein YgfZ [Variovorax sp. PCZ-1]|nr:folate-binding protein YgfZ [Variovorax sp. PCZ-1]